MASVPPSCASDTDSEADWEEVAVSHSQERDDAPPPPAAPDAATLRAAYGDLGVIPEAEAATVAGDKGLSAPAPLEITIKARKDASEESKKRGGVSHAERLFRIDCHKLHTVTLLASAIVRNRWLNDELLHARLLSLTPLALQTSFAMIHKSRVPDANKRGRLFESAVSRLVGWWSETFFEVLPEGHLRSRTFEDVQTELEAKAARTEARAKAKAARAKARARDKKGKGKARAQESSSDESDEDEDDEWEALRSSKSLAKHALKREGCRDTSALLFTALCRALSIPARLVVSLQSVPWQVNVDRLKAPTAPAKGKKRKKEEEDPLAGVSAKNEGVPDLGRPTAVPMRASVSRESGKGKGKAREKDPFPGAGRVLVGYSADAESVPSTSNPQASTSNVKLRKPRPTGRTLGSPSVGTPEPTRRTKLEPDDPLTSPPVFWTEVYSRADQRWLPVDPVRNLVNKRRAFDPSTSPPKPGVRVDNRMQYVMAIEEDGFARDVTPRYAREYGARVAKMQGAPGRGRRAWWEAVCAAVRRPYRLQRDDLEDAELQAAQLTEAMPTSLAGFKDHPLYALARHVRRDEVIHPLTELGKFRGEPVYPRGNVLQLKAAENWMRTGRAIKPGQQPMKYVPQRAVTVNKRRAIELAKEERTARGLAEEDIEVMQGLYALGQTEVYVSPPVVNGKVPKNDFGNIDLYVSTMLPAGAVHIPHKGTAKIARQLGIDFAEAVVGFEFKKRQATPVLKGIVVAAENEEALLDAWREAEEYRAEQERAKKRERVLKRWTRLVQGLRIRERLQAQYAGPMPQGATVTVDVVREADDLTNHGGFLEEPGNVVTSYSLPKSQHVRLEDVIEGGKRSLLTAEDKLVLDEDEDDEAAPITGAPDLEFVIEDDEDDLEEVPPPVPSSLPAASKAEPRSMREMAEAEAAATAAPEHHSDSDNDFTIVEPSVPAEPAPETRRATRSSGRVQSKNTRGAPSAQAKPKAPARRTRKRAREDSGTEDDQQERNVKAQKVDSGRVLRSRKSKSDADVRAEKERESALRQALGDISESE